MFEQLIEGGYIAVKRDDMEELVTDKPGIYLKVFLIVAHRSHTPEINSMKNNEIYTTINDIMVDASWKEKGKTRYPSKKDIYDALQWLKSRGLIYFEQIKDSGFCISISDDVVVE